MSHPSLLWNGSGKSQFNKVLFLLLSLPGFISPGWQGMGHLAIKTNVLKVLFIFLVLFLMSLDCCRKDTFSQRSRRKHKRIKPPHLWKSPLCKSLLWDLPISEISFSGGIWSDAKPSAGFWPCGELYPLGKMALTSIESDDRF